MLRPLKSSCRRASSSFYNLHKFNHSLNLDKSAFICIFYGATAAEIPLNKKNFGMLSENHIYIGRPIITTFFNRRKYGNAGE